MLQVVIVKLLRPESFRVSSINYLVIFASLWDRHGGCLASGSAEQKIQANQSR